MAPKLSPDQRLALSSHPGEPIHVEDEQTHKLYVIVDNSLHAQAMQALQQQEDRASLLAGIADMEAGRVVSFADVDARIRQKLGLPLRAS